MVNFEASGFPGAEMHTANSLEAVKGVFGSLDAKPDLLKVGNRALELAENTAIPLAMLGVAAWGLQTMFKGFESGHQKRRAS